MSTTIPHRHIRPETEPLTKDVVRYLIRSGVTRSWIRRDTVIGFTGVRLRDWHQTGITNTVRMGQLFLGLYLNQPIGNSLRALRRTIRRDGVCCSEWTKNDYCHSGTFLCCSECNKINHRQNGTLCASFPQVLRRLSPPSTVVQTFVECRPESPTFVSDIRLSS